MSGSRHRSINLNRIKKEVAVYNAEEKRALAALKYEANILKEYQIVDQMQKLLKERVSKFKEEQD